MNENSTAPGTPTASVGVSHVETEVAYPKGERRPSDRSSPRLRAYLLLTFALLVGSVFVRRWTWQSSAELHSVMEAIAALLALIVGTLALQRHYSQHHTAYLLIGTGFLGTGILDGFHAVITSDWFMNHFPRVRTH